MSRTGVTERLVQKMIETGLLKLSYGKAVKQFADLGKFSSPVYYKARAKAQAAKKRRKPRAGVKTRRPRKAKRRKTVRNVKAPPVNRFQAAFDFVQGTGLPTETLLQQLNELQSVVETFGGLDGFIAYLSGRCCGCG